MKIGELFLRDKCAAYYTIFTSNVVIDLEKLVDEEMCGKCSKIQPYDCPIWNMDESALLEGGGHA